MALENPGAYSSIMSKTRRANGARNSSQLPSRNVYGAYCKKMPIICLPGGASEASYCVGEVSSSSGDRDGMPYLASSQARSTYSIDGQRCMVARCCGPGAPGSALKSGKLDRSEEHTSELQSLAY